MQDDDIDASPDVAPAIDTPQVDLDHANEDAPAKAGESHPTVELMPKMLPSNELLPFDSVKFMMAISAIYE